MNDNIAKINRGDSFYYYGKFAFKFREGSVVSSCFAITRKCCWGCWRHPKTLNTLRWNEAHSLEYGVRIRKKGRKYIPTSWDDKPAHCEKSWKFQSKKRHQWE
jgi:hypothetical protein